MPKTPDRTPESINKTVKLSAEEAISLVQRIEQRLRAGIFRNRLLCPGYEPQVDRIVIGENLQPQK
jgi:hypothetical protein